MLAICSISHPQVPTRGRDVVEDSGFLVSLEYHDGPIYVPEKVGGDPIWERHVHCPIRWILRESGYDATLLPLAFSNLGAGGSLTLADAGGSRSFALTLAATA